jgi:aminotransferase
LVTARGRRGEEANFLVLFALTNPDDEVLVADPRFVCYHLDILMIGVNPVPMPLLEKDDFQLEARVVISLITDKSRVMITTRLLIPRLCSLFQ